MWFLAFGLYAAHLLPYRALTWQAGVLILAGSAAFCSGAVIASQRVSFRRPPHPIEPATVELAAGGLVLATYIGLLAFVYQVAGRFGLSAALVSNFDVRRAIIAGDMAITIKYVYIGLAATACCSVAAAVARSRARQAMWLCLTASMPAGMYFSTGRLNVVSAVLVAAVADASQGRAQ